MRVVFDEHNNWKTDAGQQMHTPFLACSASSLRDTVKD